MQYNILILSSYLFILGAKTKTRPAASCKLLLPVPKGISRQLHYLLQGLTNDKVGRVVKTDSLLLELGQREYVKLGHDPDQHNSIRQTLRRMGRLLIEVRKINNVPTTALKDLIDPARFQLVLDAVRITAGFHEDNHQFDKPTLALKLGHCLKRCAKILQGKYIEENNTKMHRKAVDFHKLCELNWQEEVSAHAMRNLYEKKRNPVKVLPLTEDIVAFSKYLKHEGQKCRDVLEEIAAGDITQAWNLLRDVTLARVILFNRRRQGEASKIKIQEYKQLLQVPRGDKVVLSSLSSIEQELCKCMHRLDIGGKRGRTVPLMLTDDMKNIIDLLIKRREDAGVLPQNVYVFARAHYGSLGHARGSDCLRELSLQCGAKEPELLRSTGLRKHIATVSQICNLRDNELDIVANFLGHDIRVHREFYRLPEEILQVAKVSKLLLALEQGNTHLAGRDLDSIEVHLDEGKDTHTQ